MDLCVDSWGVLLDSTLQLAKYIDQNSQKLLPIPEIFSNIQYLQNKIFSFQLDFQQQNHPKVCNFYRKGFVETSDILEQRWFWIFFHLYWPILFKSSPLYTFYIFLGKHLKNLGLQKINSLEIFNKFFQERLYRDDRNGHG